VLKVAVAPDAPPGLVWLGIEARLPEQKSPANDKADAAPSAQPSPAAAALAIAVEIVPRKSK
jgi:hypothetical protein